MSPEALHEELMDLARAAGFQVRQGSSRSGSDRDAPIASGICRVREVVWVVLAADESLDDVKLVIDRKLYGDDRDLLEPLFDLRGLVGVAIVEVDHEESVRPEEAQGAQHGEVGVHHRRAQRGKVAHGERIDLGKHHGELSLPLGGLAL